MRIARILVLFGATVTAIPVHLMAWGCEGHQVVAYIAEREMNPAALSNANALLQAFAITIHRNCTAPAGTTPMSDAATWADDVRFKRPDTAPWHFIDVPLPHAGEDPSPWCNDSCVIKAINDQLEVLRTADLSNPEETTTEALRFVIHFVGDIHQPLHAITNADRGGNCDPVIFGNRKPRLSGGSYSPELHGIWDTQMVQELGTASSVDDAVGLAQLLDREITAQERSTWTANGVTDWAIESSNFAATAGYVGLTRSGGSAVAASELAGSEANNKCVPAKEKAIVAMGVAANASYREASEAVIEERLKEAGVRLANLLNSIWPDDTVTATHDAIHRSRAKK